MRTLLLMRGSPGCGKSTWIKEHGLENYTLEPDRIRLMCSSPAMDVDGGLHIDQSGDAKVWALLFNILENRMSRGDFTVIDATNSKTSEMQKLLSFAKDYKYRVFLVDMTNVPMEVAKAQNRQREPLKRVPEAVIDKMYARFDTQKIPSGIEVISPDEIERIAFKKISLEQYQAVHCIGDIHGCYTALKDWFDSPDGAGGALRDDHYYIFLGDYIDRGIENVEVIKFLLDIYDRPNVCLLEGNHEIHLWRWASGAVSGSKEFELKTRMQLEEAGIDRKAVRKLYRSMRQCAWFDFYRECFASHGGLAWLGEIGELGLTKIPTCEMIKGTGSYKDADAVDSTFNFREFGALQIHGHRNLNHTKPFVNNGAINLEGSVEFGGSLRTACIDAHGIITVHEWENTVTAPPDSVISYRTENKEMKSVGDAVLAMRQNKYINEKRFGNIASFNFTKSAFYKGIWDSQTVKARGLFVDLPKERIVARSYDKFFNINERPETKLEILNHRFQFPVMAYVKENGYLGLVSYDRDKNDLFVASKSTPEGEFAVNLRAILETNTDLKQRERIKEYCRDNDVTLVFECIDPIHDPHIIEYDCAHLVLLDIIKNNLQLSKVPYAELQEVGTELGFRVKTLGYVFSTWVEFLEWYFMVLEEDYEFNGKKIEGFVLEDSDGLMVKVKLAYYNFWKFMRGIAVETLRKGHIPNAKCSALTTPTANYFYDWCRRLHSKHREDGTLDSLPTDICSLRKMFYADMESKE